MNPLSDETYRILGLTCVLQGQPAEAERALREALALSKSGTYNLAALGYALAAEGRRAEAEAILGRPGEASRRATTSRRSPSRRSTWGSATPSPPSTGWRRRSTSGGAGWPTCGSTRSWMASADTHDSPG